MMDAYLLPAVVRDALLQYLSSRPWREVQEVMPVMSTLTPAVAAEAERDAALARVAELEAQLAALQPPAE